MGQSLTGEMFPLIQLLFLLLYPAMETLKSSLSVCTRVMQTLSFTSLWAQSYTVADSCKETKVSYKKVRFLLSRTAYSLAVGK